MQERWDREQTTGHRTVPEKGFIQNRLLRKRLALILPLARLKFMWSCTTLKTNTMQSAKHTEPPSGRVTPGACPGLASDPSVGPRVNRNSQMERELHKGKLFFWRGKRLPFRDVQ